MGLMGSWHFNESDTNNVRDYSMNGLDSASVSGLTIVAGERGLAGKFDGGSTKVNFGDVGSPGTDKLVIDFKLLFITTGSNQFIIDKDGEYRVELNATSKLEFSIWNSVSGQQIVTTNATFSVGTWYRIICIYDGINAKIIIDGTEDISSAVDTLDTDTNDLLFGHEAGTPTTKHLDAKIEVIEIRDDNLTTDEIDALDKNMGGIETTMLTKHSFSEGDLLEWVSDIAGLSNSRVVCTLNKDATTILVIPISGRFVPGLRYRRRGNLFDTDRQWLAEIKEVSGKPYIFFKDGISSFGNDTPDPSAVIDFSGITDRGLILGGDSIVKKHMAIGASASIRTNEVVRLFETVDAANAIGMAIFLRSSTDTNNNSLSCFQGDFSTSGLDGTTGHTLRNFWSLFTAPVGKTATFDAVSLFETASQIGTGTGTVTNLYHFKTGIISQSVQPTNTYGIWLGDLGGTNQFPIYQSGANGTNWFFADTEFEKHVAIGVSGLLDSRKLLHLSETIVSPGGGFKFGYGIHCQTTFTSTAITDALFGVDVASVIDGSAGGTIRALRTVATSNITAGATSLIGGSFRITTGGSAAAHSTNQAVLIESPGISGAKPTTLQGIQIDNQGIGGITDSAALNIAAQSGSTNSFGIDIAGILTRNRNAGTREETAVTILGIATGNNADTAVTGVFNRIAAIDPPGPFVITGLAGGVDGRYIKIYNDTAHNMTIANESPVSAAANRINTLTGGAVACTGQGYAAFLYDGTTQRWILQQIRG